MAYKYRDTDWAVGRGRVNMRRGGEAPYEFKTGEYLGPEGMVSIMTEPPSGRKGAYNERGFTWLGCVTSGRVHRRLFHRDITERGLARMCRKFLADKSPNQETRDDG